jgi:hypothetical protein
MEARDVRAGEKPYDTHEEEIEAATQEEAWEKAKKRAEEIGEGLEVTEVEPTYDP